MHIRRFSIEQGWGGGAIHEMGQWMGTYVGPLGLSEDIAVISAKKYLTELPFPTQEYVSLVFSGRVR